MKKIKLLVCLGVIILLSQASNAQYLLNLSDQDCVELSLDKLKKGIQQENNNKISSVLGKNVIVKGVEIDAKSLVSKNITLIFDNSSTRLNNKGNLALSSSSSRFKNSNLWDFNIITPQITIKGDSAFVDCELFLQGAETGNIRTNGLTVTEILVFVSSNTNSQGKRTSIKPHGWKLVACDNLFEFLENYGVMSSQEDNNSEVQK